MQTHSIALTSLSGGDLSSKHIQNHISRLINYSKIVGDKKPFVDLQNAYNKKEFDLALINTTAFLKEYDEQIIGSLGSALKTSFIAKELFKSSHLQKSPLKFKDNEFNFLVKSDYLHNFIASTHKKNTSEPDIYGIDKNGSFINYSFANENSNPHSCIIAKSGSGKSVSKQKIIAQLIGLDFSNGACHNMQIRENDRKDYAELARKLDSIEKLGLFSTFDKIDIKDADIISMDLNNFKENSLFVPIFLSIFQKTYYKDREYALKLKREGKVRPKLFYAIEEAVNFFRVPYFAIMYDKLAREARKYNVHLCFITQDAEDIPIKTLKNLDTRIVMLEPSKKLEAIEEFKTALNISKSVEAALINTEQHEMCVWYNKGVFHMKFEISPEEMQIFSTNPNE